MFIQDPAGPDRNLYACEAIRSGLMCWLTDLELS